VPRFERDVLKHAAVLAQRNLAFGAAVEIIKNRFRNSPLRDRT